MTGPSSTVTGTSATRLKFRTANFCDFTVRSFFTTSPIYRRIHACMHGRALYTFLILDAISSVECLVCSRVRHCLTATMHQPHGVAQKIWTNTIHSLLVLFCCTNLLRNAWLHPKTSANSAKSHTHAQVHFDIHKYWQVHTHKHAVCIYKCAREHGLTLMCARSVQLAHGSEAMSAMQ